MLDEGQRNVVTRVIEVELGKLPLAQIKEQAEGGPPVTGAPTLRALDQSGGPFPWTSPPKEIRLVPPGQVGEISWGDPSFEPFYADKKLQSLGYGVPHSGSVIGGKVDYLSIDKGPGDTLVLDIVKGTVDGSPEVKAASWTHVEATDVADGWVYGYRSKRKEGAAEIELVTFLMPPVRAGYETLETKHRGAEYRTPYALYTMPLATGRSNMAQVEVYSVSVRPFKTQTFPDSTSVLFSVSQTSAEPAPRARILQMVPKRCTAK